MPRPSLSKVILFVGIGLFLVIVVIIVRNQTDGRIPVTFVVGPAGLGGRLLVDDKLIGTVNGDQLPDSSVSRAWRIRLGKHAAELITVHGDTLRARFLAEESAIVDLAHGNRR